MHLDVTEILLVPRTYHPSQSISAAESAESRAVLRLVEASADYRKRLHPFDRDAYKRRNLVERAFCRLKDFRRVATRYDKLAATYAAAISLAAIVAWWL